VAVVVTAAFTSGTAQAATGTVALWKMNETSGATMHDSATGGTVQDDGTLTNVTVGQPSISGHAYRFNGPALSYVRVPSSPDLNPDSSNFVFSVMVNFTQNPSASVGDYDLLRKGLSTTPGGDYKAEISQAGKATCEWKGSSATKELIGGSALNDGAWHTITCTKTSSKVVLRVDGTVRASATVTIGTISNSADLLLGAKATTGGDQYQGLMDQAKITLT
jgi:hypothetical protein